MGWGLPALVTADHVAVIMCEATDTASDVGTVAAILWGAERGAPGCFILAPRDKQTPLSLSDQHGGGRGGRRRRWGPRPIVVVLLVRAKEVDHVEKVYEVGAWQNHVRYTSSGYEPTIDNFKADPMKCVILSDKSSHLFDQKACWQVFG